MLFEFEILHSGRDFCILLSGAQNTLNKKNLRDSHGKHSHHKDLHYKKLQGE